MMVGSCNDVCIVHYDQRAGNHVPNFGHTFINQSTDVHVCFYHA